MLFTKECDYAVRVFRCLAQVYKMNVQEIAKREDMTVATTYKVTRKLEQAGYLRSHRGVKGGYSITASLQKLTLYDVFHAIDKDFFITECVNHQFSCSKNTESNPCMVHKEFCRIQGMIYNELKSKTLEQVMKSK